MIDFARALAEPEVFNAVLAVLTALATWATWLFQRLTRTKRELFAQDTIHRAAQTFTDAMLDVLEEAVRTGTPVGRIDGYLDAGLDYITRESAPGGVKVLDATRRAIVRILTAKANERMHEIKSRDPLTEALRDAGAPAVQPVNVPAYSIPQHYYGTGAPAPDPRRVYTGDPPGTVSSGSISTGDSR